MVRSCCALLFLFLAAVSWPCFADAPTPQSISPSESSVGTLAPTPEMWFYEQERARHDDVRQQVADLCDAHGRDQSPPL